MNGRLRLLTPVLAAVLLQACATAPPPRVDDSAAERRYAERLARLQSAEQWVVEGRLAVRDDGDGGSGSLRWQQQAAQSRLDFHGALGRGAWRLRVTPLESVLTLADGAEYRAPTVERLVAERIGWRVPVGELAWWIRGLAAPSGEARRALGEAGELRALDQAGWSIEFDRYRSFGGELLPGLVVARQGERLVKFAVRDWALGDAARDDG